MNGKQEHVNVERSSTVSNTQFKLIAIKSLQTRQQKNEPVYNSTYFIPSLGSLSTMPKKEHLSWYSVTYRKSLPDAM